MKETFDVRSAVLFSLKAYNLALDDIRLALEVLPSFLSRYTASENPIYVFPEEKLRGLTSNFPRSCICERFIYSHDRSAYFSAAE
jgi:hypothetical protein